MRDEKEERNSKRSSHVLRLQLQARDVRERGRFRRVPEGVGGILHDLEEV
jgi:HD superfamily phosphohydrolase YqeK